MAAIRIDTSNPHLWLMHYPRDAGVEEYVASVESMMALNPDKRRVALIQDMRESVALGASSKARRRAAEVLEKHSSWFTEVTVCSARVASDPVVRGVLTVYDVIAPGPWPRKSFSTGESAEAWARSRLAAAGIECDPKPVWRS